MSAVCRGAPVFSPRTMNPDPAMPLKVCAPDRMPNEGFAMPFDGVEFVSNDSLRKIDAVIDLLATPERWCKGALRSHDGRYCIRGAVRAVNAAEVLEPTILRAIGEVAGQRFRRIESFNDHPNTSHEQILAVLSRARHHLRAGTIGGGGAVEPQTTPVPGGLRGAVLRWFR
jgi:hypothetical protein